MIMPAAVKPAAATASVTDTVFATTPVLPTALTAVTPWLVTLKAIVFVPVSARSVRAAAADPVKATVGAAVVPPTAPDVQPSVENAPV